MSTETLVEKVRRIDPRAAEALAGVPPLLQKHLRRRFPADKSLAIAILAATQLDPVPLLAFKYRIPARWVEKAKEACLRTLREKQPEVWKLDKKQDDSAE